MAARSIASLSLSFGLVSIPIKLYSATESSSGIQFKLMGAGGSRVRQQYVTDAPAYAEEQPAAAAVEPPGEDEQPEDDAQPGQNAREEPEQARDRRSAAARVVEFPSSKRELPAPPTSYRLPVATPAAGAPAAVRPSVVARAVAAPAVIERSEMVRGYEFEKGKFVVFTAAELKALEERSRQTIDIVAFIPEHAVDPIYYHKAYFLAPDKRGSKPYNLLHRAMIDTGRCALAKWAFRSKEYVVQIRPAERGLVLQQLLYAEEVRSLAELNIEQVEVGEAELKLARQLIEQISVDAYDPTEFVDEEKKRILAAVEEKIAGKQIVAPEAVATSAGAHQVVDLMAALRASLQQRPAVSAPMASPKATTPTDERKPPKRAAKKAVAQTAPDRRRSGKS
jgi:DNA end-binding protein Ku